MILAAVPDLMFRSRIGEVARAKSVEIRFVRTTEELVSGAPGATLVLLDLDRGPDAVAEIRKAAPGVRVLGFYSHVNRDVRDRAVAAGAETMTRGEFTRRLPEIL